MLPASNDWTKVLRLLRSLPETPESGPTSAAGEDGSPEQPTSRTVQIRKSASRAEVERSLRDDPIARGTLLTLLAAALVALGLALVGVLLGVVSDVRDERGELDDLEAQGARPALLRRVVRLRSLVVVAVGVVGGLATAALLGFLVVDLVTVTADARATELPLRTAVAWPVLAAALTAGILAAATLVTAASRRI